MDELGSSNMGLGEVSLGQVESGLGECGGKRYIVDITLLPGFGISTS
jgi:hypothetical protein